VFAYTGARLASGVIDFAGVGPAYPVEEIITMPIHEPQVSAGKVKGIFEIGDPNFGNLWTNIPLETFQQAGFKYGDQVKCTVTHAGKVAYQETIPFSQSFGFVGKGEVSIYNNELMRVSVCVNQGSFSETYHLSYGPDWVVEFEK
jgi:S-adenosylmethionine hydrolase